MTKVFVIAEIGINHNGDINLAKKLIDVASRNGCDAVKFQKRDINVVYTKDFLSQPRESPWGITQFDQKNGLEFDYDEYIEIDKYCKEKKIEWFASAWDINSLVFLDQFNLKYNKIASAMITNVNFLNEVAKRKKYTFISTGMSNLKDIEKAINIFKDNNCEFELMHSVSTYPAKEKDLNLNVIKTLSEKFGCKVGYSGHEPSVSPSIVACVLGATSLERHITLDRTSYGSDQAASLEENGLNGLMQVINKLKDILGDGKKTFIEAEKEVAKKLRYWE
jgi:N-acetylneuraminate synthase